MATNEIVITHVNHKELPFSIGDIVFLKTDVDQFERIVTGICIKPTGYTYELTLCDKESWHYDFEISRNMDIIKATSN